LGHLDDPRAVALIAQLLSYPNAETRFAVACALGSFPNDPLSLETLLTLMADSDRDVRDWATFGVGVLGEADSSTVRDALMQAVNDSNEDVREEALVALGKRQDKRALARVLMALKHPTVTDRIIEAAYTLLGLDSERKDWTSQDYTNALNERFSPSAKAVTAMKMAILCRRNR
jgi:HEAT repeat protein